MTKELEDHLKLIKQRDELNSLLANQRKSLLKRKLSKVTNEDKMFIVENLKGSFNSYAFKTTVINIRDKYELSDREAMDYVNKIVSNHKKKKSKLPF